MGRQSSTRLRPAVSWVRGQTSWRTDAPGGRGGGRREGREGWGWGVLYSPVKLAWETLLHNKSVRGGKKTLLEGRKEGGCEWGEALRKDLGPLS